MTEPETVRIGGTIPGLIWRADRSGQCPVIISLHGGGGSKADIAPDIAARVTGRDISLVTIDAHRHGDRRHGTEEPFTDWTHFMDILERTAQDLFAVYQWLESDSAIDAQRVGLRGGSMGGHIALMAVGMGLPVSAVLSVCGSADLVRSFPERFRAMARGNAERLREIEEHARDIDPISHLDRFPPRPILMIHGLHDPQVPIGGHRALYEALTPLYADRPEDCLFLTHAGGHETPQALEDLGWNWLMDRISG